MYAIKEVGKATAFRSSADNDIHKMIFLPDSPIMTLISGVMGPRLASICLLMTEAHVDSRCNVLMTDTTASTRTVGAGLHSGSPGSSVRGAPRTCMSVTFTW